MVKVILDPPAAMRYTEIKLQKVSEEMLFDLKKDTVDMKLNFDSTSNCYSEFINKWLFRNSSWNGLLIIL